MVPSVPRNKAARLMLKIRHSPYALSKIKQPAPSELGIKKHLPKGELKMVWKAPDNEQGRKGEIFTLRESVRRGELNCKEIKLCWFDPKLKSESLVALCSYHDSPDSITIHRVGRRTNTALDERFAGRNMMQSLIAYLKNTTDKDIIDGVHRKLCENKRRVLEELGFETHPEHPKDPKWMILPRNKEITPKFKKFWILPPHDK